MDNVEQFRRELVVKLLEIQKITEEWGISLSNITLLMRDPNNDKTIVLLSTESNDDVRYSFRLAEERMQASEQGEPV